MKLTPTLRAQYVRLFNSCQIKPAKFSEVDKAAKGIISNKQRYGRISSKTGVPWYIIGIIHYRECNLSFQKHLANGDPLTSRTVRVPKGLPAVGTPPFDFDFAAIAALEHQRLHKVTCWNLADTLWLIEGFNGYGYWNRSINIPSPYLWSYSNHYTKGLFDRDHHFNPAKVSKQCGSAVLLRRLCELGEANPEVNEREMDWVYGPRTESAAILELQKILNAFPGVYLKEDGRAGPRTSDAYLRVFGRYLPGDPRVNPEQPIARRSPPAKARTSQRNRGR